MTLQSIEWRQYLQVSGWFVMTTPDVKRMAPLWLKYSEDVRMDPEVLYPGMCYTLTCATHLPYVHVNYCMFGCLRRVCILYTCVMGNASINVAQRTDCSVCKGLC